MYIHIRKSEKEVDGKKKENQRERSVMTQTLLFFCSGNMYLTEAMRVRNIQGRIQRQKEKRGFG